MFALQLAKRAATVAASKRQFGGFHAPAENPILQRETPLLRPWAYTRDTANTTYADKFPHPMNYQGHVPVTPTKFSPSNFENGAFEYNPRVVNAPTTYFFAAIATSLLTAYFAAVTTEAILINNGRFAIDLGMTNTPAKFWHYIVRMQQGSNLDSLKQQDYKNIYETEEFNNQLQQYVKQRRQ